MRAQDFINEQTTPITTTGTTTSTGTAKPSNTTPTIGTGVKVGQQLTVPSPVDKKLTRAKVLRVDSKTGNVEVKFDPVTSQTGGLATGTYTPGGLATSVMGLTDPRKADALKQALKTGATDFTSLKLPAPITNLLTKK